MRPRCRQEADDLALLRRVAAGDEAALASLYDRHAGWLMARMHHRCASVDLVDQALQDTFLALWHQAGRYRGDGDVPAFIWGIGVRRLIDAIRRDGTAARAAQAVRASWQSATGAELIRSAEEEVLLGVEHGQLGQALASLSPELRGAIEATVLDGLTCAEAGRLLGIPAGTVKSRCHRARIELREALSGQAQFTQPRAREIQERETKWGEALS